MTNDLKAHLEANPHLSHVYVNDNNEWQFHKREGFDTEYTREEILDMDLPDQPDEAQDKVESVDPVLATELEKTIEALITAESERDELLKEKEAWQEEKAELEKTIAELTPAETEPAKEEVAEEQKEEEVAETPEKPADPAGKPSKKANKKTE